MVTSWWPRPYEREVDDHMTQQKERTGQKAHECDGLRRYRENHWVEQNKLRGLPRIVEPVALC